MKTRILKPDEIDESKLIQGQPVDRETKLWLSIGEEAIRKSPEMVTTSLNRLVVLATALAGGAIGAPATAPLTQTSRIVAASFFLLALAISALGSLPLGKPFSLNIPDTIRLHREHVVKVRSRTIYFTVLAILLGLGSAILGMVSM